MFEGFLKPHQFVRIIEDGMISFRMTDDGFDSQTPLLFDQVGVVELAMVFGRLGGLTLALALTTCRHQG